MIARLVRSADFERVLRTRSRASSEHFALHHVGTPPSRPAAALRKLRNAELSTGQDRMVVVPVDDSPSPAPETVWLGAVVPKRHARRSVTRNLLKRQIRAAVGARDGALAGGLWVVRLRAPFDRERFVSAASVPLARAARAELDRLLDAAPGRAGSA